MERSEGVQGSDGGGGGARRGVDKSPQCQRWAELGECEKNPSFMRSSCEASCSHHPPTATAKAAAAVRWEVPTLAAELALAQAQTDRKGASLPAAPRGCADVRTDCAQLARWNLSACGEAPFMLTECARTCRTCGYSTLISEVTGECVDKRKECDSWARAGECEANKRFMLSSCSAACGVCELKKVGCSRRITQPGLRSPAGMSEMFTRALSGDTLAKHSTKALSTDPYVLQFENMVSAKEAQDIINRCAENNRFERSMAGDQLSPVRTSTQCWCDDTHGCTEHPTIRTVTERLMNITGMPVDNAEYFQILKYEKDQFYKVHHDQQTAHWTPQGVRVFTFFLYLSDVTAGGGTRFTDLGLVVQPKLGRAVLWPSVKGEDLLSADMRTNHEALPVIDGVKYAANLWIHLYDFKTPSRAGLCPFLGQNTNG